MSKCFECGRDGVYGMFCNDDCRKRYEYQLARRTGDARFGSHCKHETVSGGRCVKCGRRVR